MFVNRFFFRYWRHLLAFICGLVVIITSPACQASRRNSGTPMLIISSIASSNISAAGATVSWSTNRPASSQVEYGVTTGYGNVVSLNTMVTSHQLNLVGLNQNTLYNYRVKSSSEDGNLSTSGNLTFKTEKVVPSIDLFKATPDSIDTVPPNGQSSVLSFSVKDATSLRLDPGAIDVTGLTSRTVTVTTTTIYTLTATNSSGSVARNVTVMVRDIPPPTLPSIDEFKASPDSITLGQSSLLSWVVKDATSLRLDRGADLNPRFIDVTGQFSRTETPSETTIYTLTVINSAGSVTRNVTVKVMKP